MKKYGITILIIFWSAVLALDILVVGQQRFIDFRQPGTVSDNMIPDANSVYDLGSTSYRWKDVWVSGGSVHIGSFTLEQDTVDNDGLEIAGSIHSAVVDGKSGNFCIHEANEPTASNDSTGSRLWVDPNGVLQHQKSSDAGGGSKAVIVDDGAGNVGIGTNDPKREFDFDGANVRTQRYIDSDLNTNIGYETFGAENLSGTHNSAFGRHSLYSVTSGGSNSGFGNEVLHGVTTGSNNIGVGSMSGKGVVGGSHNISLGYKSGYVVANGNNNISIGSYSNYVGTGSKNITIGYNIDLPIDAGNNQLNIGNLIYGTGLDGVDKGVSAGNVGIGVVDPSAKLEVNGYTMLGSDAPGIKMKKFTGTTDADSLTSVSTGILRSKVVMLSTFISDSSSRWPPGQSTFGRDYYAYVNDNEVILTDVAASVQSDPYEVYVFYTE
jgi:hypothetical protein